MAKTKISEIMKTYGVEKEELASFLKEKGVEVKTTGSSVDEDTMKLVEARFGKKAEPSQKNDKSSEAADSSSDGQKVVRKVVTPVKKKKIIIVTGGNAAGKTASHQAGSYSAGGTSKSGYNAGTGASGAGRSRSGSGQGNRPAAAANTGAYHPIKPKTAPSQMELDYRKPIPRSEQPVPKKTPAPVVEEQEKKVNTEAAAQAVQTPVEEKKEKLRAAEAAVSAETAAVQTPGAFVTEEAPAKAAAAEEKRENAGGNERSSHAQSSIGNGRQGGRNERGGDRTDFRRGQGGFNANGSGARRPASSGDRNERGGRPSYGQNGQNGQGGGDRRGGQGRPGFGGDRRPGQGGKSGASGRGFGGKDNAAPQEFGTANKRRNPNGVARDRHNKKDVAFEQNEQRERKNRSGRFIKPVVEKIEAPEEQIKVITIPEKLTIGELAEAMHLKPAELIKKLFLAGKAMTVNSEVTYEEAENIAAD